MKSIKGFIDTGQLEFVEEALKYDQVEGLIINDQDLGLISGQLLSLLDEDFALHMFLLFSKEPLGSAGAQHTEGRRDQLVIVGNGRQLRGPAGQLRKLVEIFSFLHNNVNFYLRGIQVVQALMHSLSLRTGV